MKNQIKQMWYNFISDYKKKTRSELIEEITNNCVDNLTKNSNDLTNRELGLISTQTHNRIKSVLIDRAERLKQELEETKLTIDEL